MATMKQPTDKLQVNILGMLVAVIGFGLVALYVTMVFSAHDAFWFWRGFEDKPARIMIYQGGQRTELQFGDPGFAELAEAVRASLAQGVDRPSSIGLSEGSLQDAYTQFVTLEAFFDHPVKLHAWFNTDDPTQMLFPITGRHSDLNVVFLGREGIYMSNGPVLKTTEPIRDVLRSQGFLQ
jgi:hypothetical protein